ncbi:MULTISPECIES: hypothetical protein [Kocuria]|jgi:ABC-type transporter Mla MlaB component|uniref:hypothetical protein n=1 Tax=Kocuria TaxID=57493 RepID=UPI0020404A0A|nr:MULTISPECIES: hypothetical protein [Kocuria]MCM3687120.1 hypothetical protein [Kocuria rosea]HST71862.1 hypothetical protein [Kocuria rosea]
MDHNLSVVVQVDLHGRYVHLVVTGCLTELNHRALPPLIRRARALVPDVTVNVDLTSAQHVEPLALELLQRWVEAVHAQEPGGPVRVLTRPVPFGFPGATEPFQPAGRWTVGDLDGVAA